MKKTLAVLALVAVLAGCDTEGTPGVDDGEDAVEFDVRLDDGRTLHCVWVTKYGGSTAGVAGMDCEGW